MKAIMTRIVHSPIASTVVILVISFGFITGFNDLFLDSSTDSLLTEGDADVEYLEEIQDLFGDAVIQSIIIKSKTVFRDDILQSILDLTSDAERLTGVDRVVSMATVSNIKGDNDFLNTDPLLTDIPSDFGEMDILKDDTFSNSMFMNEVINATGTVTGIHLFLQNEDMEKDFDNRILMDIERLVKQAEEKLPGDVEIYHIGTSKLKSDMIRAMNHDAMRLVPLAGAMVGIVLLFFFKTGAAVLIPVLSGSLSIAATLGFMGIMGFGINPVSVIIPTLLFVMGSTEDIHLFSEYLRELEHKISKKQAILNMAVKSGTAIALTSLTTFLGFATIMPNPTPILREFGIAASFGIAINFIITILIVPVILRVYKTPKVTTKKVSNWEKLFGSFLFTAITRYRVFAIGLLVVVLVISLWGTQKVYVETDYVKFFKKDADVPVLLDKLDKDLVGGTNFMVVVESKEFDAFQTHASLKHVARLHDYINEHHGKAVGYVDLLRKTHQEMHDGHKKFYKIPDNDNLIAQYNLIVDADYLLRFVDYDFTKTSILVRSRISGTRQILAAYDDIQRFAQENLSLDLTYHVTGEMIVVARASNDVTREVLTSLGIMFTAIFLVSSLLFLSLKAGALAMIPNILPVIVTFGFMGFMNIPLSVATFPITIIALGIAVDDTIHFMIRYASELKKADSNELSIMNTLQMEFRPILSTSVALMAGFLMLLFGEFGSTVQFGTLTALCMLVAMLSDLLITPMLLIEVPIISPLALMQSYVRKKLSYDRCHLLKGFTKGEVRRVMTMGEIKFIEAGVQFMTQGDSSSNMVLILEGMVDVLKENTGEVLATLQPGDIVGEMGFVTDEPRSASVVTQTRVEILEIDKRLIHLVASRFPKVGNKLFYNISQILSLRLKNSM